MTRAFFSERSMADPRFDEENAALKAQVKTLRECMGLRGMRGVDGAGGGGGAAAVVVLV